MVLFFVATFCSRRLDAQQVEATLPLSQRFTINLSAGVPAYVGNAASTSNAPQSQWWFENTKNSATYATTSFVESSDPAWQQVGLPYDANIPRTFINQDSGGGAGSDTGQNNWYRLHFKVDPKYAGQKFLLNLEGAHTGVQVFINGTLLPGISAVAADAQATHVVGFVPVVVDLTPYLHADGATDNVIAIDVSRGSPWFEQPQFSNSFRFGQDMAGLFRNVFLYVTNPVHIPLNVYSNTKTWGTYVGTVSEVAGAEGVTATAASAVVEVQTNVVNETATVQQVTLTTQIVDAAGNVVVTAPPVTQSVSPMTAGTFPSTPTPIFQQLITVPNPTLWYPNNSIYGKPYMYKVYHLVSVNGVVVDSFQSPLGIRTITWDANFPYFNGHAMYLWGGSSRYDYPALGSSVPDEQWWRDMAQIAAQGGNVWRPGHSTSSEEMVEAADAYGIMIDQPSGDGEGHWNASSNPSADDLQLKQEVHRDMIIRDRSHPSILDWEEDNGGMNQPLANELATIETSWDNINPRVQADRTYSPSYSFMGECDGAGCETGVKNQNPNNPSFGAEYWDNMGTGRGTQTGTGANTVYAYDYELAFAAPYLDDWRQGKAANAFGMAQWYFADTPGEDSLWAEFQNQPAMQHFVRSLGYSSVDQNRFPRLLYYIYQANWIPYSIQPVVHLAHDWNRAYEYTPGTPIQENAFSNCPSVRLLINGVAKDPVTGAILADQVPNPWNINSHADLSQSTKVMPGQVHWMVNWAPGTVTAECLDTNGNVVPGVTHSVATAGAENKIVLSVVPEVVKPDGTSFQWTSNGSDAAFVMAEVQDANGNVVPTAADNVTFTVTGPATYMGGTQQLVADPSWTDYYQDAFSKAHTNDINGEPYIFFHSPGDPELNFEGGLQKIALRSTFTPGTVTVTATAPGLASGSVQLTSVTPTAPPQSQPPAIIVPPVDTAVTAGQPATFIVAATGSGTLSYQWAVAGSEVTGQTSPTLTIPAATLAQNGESVTVAIHSNFGDVTSTPVTLTVDAPAGVAITTQPATQTVVVGQSATFTVAATGSPQLNYQWFQNGTQVQTGPQPSYTTPILTAVGTASIYVVVSNPVNQMQSATAALTINAPMPVSIVTSPANQIVATNQPVQFTAVVAGSAPYTYQWQFTPKGGSATILLSNTQSSSIITYTIPTMSTANVGAYTVTVNNAAAAPVTSAAAQLTLAPPGVNLALNKTATSSSSQNACKDATTKPPLTGAGCLGAENAVDGNLNTRWGSATAGAPPTTPVPGVDPSWLQVDLGSVQSFNTVIINWENAYAAQYQIQYTDADPSTNPTWNVATTNNAGVGGTETLTFNTVQARYIRLFATVRSGNFGYSIFEFQVYNVPNCGGPSERYTVSSANPSLVMDNVLGLTWTRTIQTDSAIGSQFTGVSAAAYCKSINMRIPTEIEALGISGNNNASCAFPGTWSTWTSTLDPNDATETAIVNFDGSSTFNVTNNFPGATLCTEATGSGASGAQAPVIETQPQSTTVAVGESATFTVFAAGTPAPIYQWLRNGSVLVGATGATYTTPPTVATDNGASFSVSATNGSGTVTSNSAVLTVTNNSTGGGGACSSVPTAPTGLKATATSSSSIGLNWTAVIAPTNCSVGSYNVYGSTTAGFTPSAANLLAAGVTGTSYSNTGLAASTTYYYVVEAVDGDGASTASNQSSAMTGSGTGPTTPDFSLSVSSASLPVTAGSSGTETITLTPQNGFTPTAAVNFTCSGLPSDATCSFSPTTVTSTGNMVSTLTVKTTMASSTASYKSSPWFPGSVLAVALYFFGRRKRRGLQLLLLAVCVASMTLLTGCGVQPPPPQMATSMITVTASAGSLNHTTTFSLVVATPNVPPTSAEVHNLSPLLPGSMLAVALCFVSRKRRYRVQLMLAMCVFGMALLSGCGSTTGSPSTGGSQTSSPTPPATTIAPAITVPPASIAVTAGQTATFSVTATGTAPLAYQWQSNGSSIAGATAATYTTPALTTKNNGTTFAVVVTNAAGSVTSSPATLTVTAGGSTGCGAAPGIPGSPVATAASSSQIGLSWSASSAGSSCTVTYNVYRGTTSGFTPASGNLVASGQTGTSFTDNGLTAATTYFYAVVAVDAVGSSAASTQVSATTLSASSPTTPCTTVPAQPAGLVANAASVSSISVAWTADTTPAGCSITYNVYATTASGFVPSQTNLVASGLTSNLYTNTGLAASTTYFYVIEAVDGAGNSTPSAQVQDTTTASPLSEIIAIHSGGPAVSNANGGDASFVADEYYDTGGTSGSGAAVSVAGVTNAAPEAVYQTERNGAFSYTIPGLQPGASYTVLLHFAENFFKTAGSRIFSVAINGTTVLANLDIFQEAGGENIALVEPFTATANPQGQIVISYIRGSKDQPKSSGIEIRGLPSTCTLLPAAAPTGLTAQATSPSIINLNWQTVTPPPNCAVTYNLYGSTTSGFTPSASNLIASGLTNLSYSNTGLAASSTYYYVVEAVDTDGASVPSAQISASTNPANSCISVPTVAPAGFAATGASSSAIGLSWAAIAPPANCTNVTYNVYSSSTSGFVPSLSNEIAVALANPVFFNTSLPASSNYYYVVQAVDEDGVSSQFSNQVSAATLAPPTQLTATATSANEIDLTFPASTAPAPVNYNIYRSTAPTFTPSGTTKVGSTKSNFYNDAVVTAATTYYYIVQASSPNGTTTVGGPASATSLALGNATPFWDTSNLPPTAAGAVLVVKFLNRTNGQYPDDQVFWSATINGVTVTNSIAAQPILQLPAGASGRIPIYLGTPSQNANSYSDFLEYTIGFAGNSTTTYFINMDTTRVDNFGIKNAFQLTCGDGTNIAIGENAGAFAESRASTFQRYLNAVPPNFQTLAQVQAPYRIVSPGDGGFDTGGPYVSYYNDWINQLWAVNGITATPPAIPNGDGLGAFPGLSAAIYRHVGGVAGTFNPNGSLANQGLWGNPDQFYQTEPFSYYGKFLHQIAINGQQYTFPYDDNGGYSSDVSCNSPKTLVVAIGW
ncbi:immunoglobulin domain-containing protein [Tunturiibacter lichenicola]|uniref:immunoglobulin domain-containing protein n=1 Tax=Tunturiibacter lichenicola TaxID=2051959 RepID=UPI003D9BA081